MGVAKSGTYKQIESGTRKNRLTFVAELPTQDRFGRYFVTCLCDCGRTTTTRKHAFMSGRIKSCGCAQIEAASASGKSKRGEPGMSNFRNVFSHYKRGAKKRGLCFEISEADFYAITQCPCSYCGSPPAQVAAQESKFGAFVYNGIDRIENSIGYVVGNVAACCKYCNHAKWTMTVEQFTAWIARVHNHLQVVKP